VFRWLAGPRHFGFSGKPAASRALGSTSRQGLGLLGAKMSDDFEDQAAEAPAAKPARKKPAARKAAKTAKTKPAASAVEAPAEVRPAAPVEPVAAAPVREARESEPREPREPRSSEAREAPTSFFVDSPVQESGGSSKKRRRRKKKSGQGQGQGQAFQAERSSTEIAAVPAFEGSPAPVSQSAPRSKVDSEEVAKKAWKIFQAEVGEEGLALIDDHDAREISRRCFRLAEIFLDEAARRSR